MMIYKIRVWGLLVFYLFLILILVWFHLRGIIYYDEGYILHAAMQTANGLVPYRDFDMVYTPLSFVTVALFFKIFGQSVLVGRVVALFISLFSLFAIFQITKLLNASFSALVFASLLFVLWGPVHINFPWPTMFALCLTLYDLLFILNGLLKNRKYFFIAGIFSMLIFLAKQNFGVVIPLLSVVSIIYFSKKYSFINLKLYAIGFLLALLLFILYLSLTNSFFSFIQSFNVNTIQKIIFEKTLDTPFLYQGTLFSKIGKLFFYTSPLLISLITIFVVHKIKKVYLIIPLYVIAFYLIGIRPTTDLDHFVALLAFAGLNSIILIEYIKKSFHKIILYIALFIFIITGLYTAVFGGYYKWETPIRYDNTYDSYNRVKVFLTPSSLNLSNALSSYIDVKTNPGDKIYLNYYSPMVYFLSDRDNATKYDYLNIPLSYQKEVIKDLQNKKVKLVILNEVNLHEKTAINKYIQSHYHFDKKFGDFLGYYIN